MMKVNLESEKTTRDILFISLAAALITVCSWIFVPLTVPITLQTFAVFVVVGILGLKRGTLAVLVYILIGAIGMPVFSGGKGGFGILMGNTGGYIIGFIFSALVVGGITKIFGNKKIVLLISMTLGLIVCYLFGTAWFIYLYTKNTGVVSLFTVLSWCVFPFIIPDVIKIGIAVVVVDRVAKYVKFGAIN